MYMAVSDVLRLPCMRGAEVVAGRNGLAKLLDSVTVLEYCAQTELLKKLFRDNTFNGNEIIITAFASIADNVEAQCQNIRLYHGVGSVGMILYYVGLILPEIDSRLIDICNELDYPLICMPREYSMLQYREAITEITFELYRRRQRDQYFVSSILERVSDLSSVQQTMDSLLRMLSDHLQCSVILIDKRDDTHSVAAWPRSFVSSLNDHIRSWIKEELGDKDTVQIHFNDEKLGLFKCPGLERDAAHLELYLLSYDDKVPSDVLRQSSELLQLFLHTKSFNRGRIPPTELISAILSGEPLRIEKLARLCRIDVSVLNQMWLIRSKEEVGETRILQECNEFLSLYSSTFLTGRYMGQSVVFSQMPSEAALRKEQLQGMAAHLGKIGWQGEIVCCDCLGTVKEAQQAYLDSIQYLDTAKQIFPGRKIFSYADIRFAHLCLQAFEKRGENADQYATLLKKLRLQSGIGEDLLETLCVYLLDADSNIAQTSKRLFVHANTVKYRLKTVRELTGIVPNKMPDALPLYIVAALHRMISSDT